MSGGSGSETSSSSHSDTASPSLHHQQQCVSTTDSPVQTSNTHHPARSSSAVNQATSSYRPGTGTRSCTGRAGHHRSADSKTTRIRTVLNEKQLHTLRTCYSANSRPDALMKEQLVEMTGLSPRVIRVWFQNKRCKDKKRSLALKQLHQQQQNKVRPSHHHHHHHHWSYTPADTRCGMKSNPVTLFAVFSATAWKFSVKFYRFMRLSYLHLTAIGI